MASSKFFELDMTITAGEILYLMDDFRKFIKDKEVVSRTTVNKLETAIQEYKDTRSADSYNKESVAELSLGNTEFMSILVGNHIIDIQHSALSLLCDTMLEVLSKRESTRVVTGKFLSDCEDAVAKKAANLLSHYNAARNKDRKKE